MRRMTSLQSVLTRVDLRPGGPQFYIAAIPAMVVAYALALAMTYDDMELARALAYALVPTSVIALMALPTRAIILHYLFRTRPMVQAPAHILIAITFSILLFWLRMIVSGMFLSGDPMRIELPDFFAPGAAWMLIEGVLIYTLISLTTYVETLRVTPIRLPEAVPALAEERDAPFRLFVRQNDEFRPIDTGRIILARGADDYAEVVTASGVHLVRMTLSALSDRLGSRFIRIHRSCLVNVEQIGKAEPAGGGRILLHMEDGTMVATSRAGARLLREHIV